MDETEVARIDPAEIEAKAPAEARVDFRAMLDRGWLHFNQAPTHQESATGERRLSVAVADDGVVFTVVKDGRPTSCTISLDDWDLLQHFVELRRQ